MGDINMEKRREILSARLQEAFGVKQFSLKDKQEFAFHMLDWMEDFYKLYDLYENIDQRQDKEVRKIIIDFLAHVPNHLNAAMYLSGLGKVEDVFNLGIIEKNVKK